MALLFMDGFAANDWQTKWSSGSNPGPIGSSSPAPRIAGGVWRRLEYIRNEIRKDVVPSNKIFVGLGVYVNSGSSNFFMVFRGDSNATTHITVSRNTSNGTVEIRRGATLLASSSVALPPIIWSYLEVSVSVADVDGEVHVRLNGDSTDIVSYTGDTKNGGTNSTIDSVYLYITGSSNDVYLSDVYIANDTGTTNNDFLGDVAVGTLRPNANGSYSQLMGSDANQIDNYLLVDETPFSSVDYSASSIIGEKDTYALQDLPNNASTVYGVQINASMRKDGAGTAQSRTVLRSGGTDYMGDTQTLSTSSVTYIQLYEQDPATSANWTISGVDSAEAGMEVV